MPTITLTKRTVFLPSDLDLGLAGHGSMRADGDDRLVLTRSAIKPVPVSLQAISRKNLETLQFVKGVVETCRVIGEKGIATVETPVPTAGPIRSVAS
jgi:hypothetical protein